MKDEQRLKLFHEQNLGARVAAFLQDEFIKKLLQETHQDIIDLWRDCEDPTQREQLWFRLQGLRDFASKLGTVVNTGKMAGAQIERARAKGEIE